MVRQTLFNALEVIEARFAAMIRDTPRLRRLVTRYTRVGMSLNFASARIDLALGLLILYQLFAPAAAIAAEVTARAVYVPAIHRRGKSAEGMDVVIWLTPLTSELSARVEGELAKLPHRFLLVQEHKHFDPHLLIVPVGSLVGFPNRDPFFHNVFSLFDGKRFDLGLYEAGSTRSIKFDRPGVSFIFCNIHPQMSAIIIAVKTPYYAVANKSGDLEISGVPAGRYRMEVWSERALPETLKSLQREVDIPEGGGPLGEIQIKSSGDLLSGHKNKYGADYDPSGASYPAYKQP